MAKGKISDILVIRLQRGEEIIGSITRACQEYGVKNAVIISMIGSLNGATYCNTVLNPNVKCGNSQADPVFLECPVQVLSAHGQVCHEDDGEISIHIHATFVDSQGKAYGGHLVEEGNQSLNTIDIFIGVVEGVGMGFEWDDELDGKVFFPKQL